MRVALIALGLAWSLGSGVAGAQTRIVMQAPPRVSKGVEVGISGLAGLPVSYGTTSADLTAPNGSPVVLFRAEKRQGPELGLRTHIAGPVRSRVFAEVAASISRANFETILTDDFENAATTVATLQLLRFDIDGGVGWNLWLTDRGSVFLIGGAGWVREVVDLGTLADNGTVVTAGAGMKYWRARRNPRQWRYGVRLDGRLAMRWNAVALDNTKIQLAPVFTVGLIFGS
jgi:hypothetical protein